MKKKIVYVFMLGAVIGMIIGSSFDLVKVAQAALTPINDLIRASMTTDSEGNTAVRCVVTS